jgi:hypothetical protein
VKGAAALIPNPCPAPPRGSSLGSHDVRHLAVENAIAPPAVVADNVKRFRRVELRSLHWGEPFSQQGYTAGLSDVLDRLVAKRDHVQTQYVDAKVQIAPKGVFLDRLLQIAVRGGDDPYIGAPD